MPNLDRAFQRPIVQRLYRHCVFVSAADGRVDLARRKPNILLAALSSDFWVLNLESKGVCGGSFICVHD
jgi:hypothetical protein